MGAVPDRDVGRNPAIHPWREYRRWAVRITSLGLGLFTLFWFLRGVAFYGADERKLTLALPLAPVVSVVHSMGTVAGTIDPPDDFRVTEKAGIQ